MRKKFNKVFPSPTELTLEVLGGKWKTVILGLLKDRSCRYAELRKSMPNLSDNILTRRLGELVDAGMIAKKKAPHSGKIVVYVLTKRARSLDSILNDLYIWGKFHATEFDAKIEESPEGVVAKDIEEFGK
jgi:DNA-binding HxlR family transcriptional regulator